MTNSRKKIVKITISILFIIIIGFLIWGSMKVEPKAVVTTTESYCEGDKQVTYTQESTIEGLSKYIDYLILVLGISTIWIWRKELGIKKLGPAEAADQIDIQNPDKPISPTEDDRSNISVDEESLNKSYNSQQIKSILELLKERRSVSITSIVNELNISGNTAQKLVAYLVEKEILRADGNKRRKIYTPTDSLENRILDFVKQKMTARYGNLIEKRYLVINKRYEVDALLENEDLSLIIEAKVINSAVSINTIEQWGIQLIKTAEALNKNNLVSILAIYFKKSDEKKRIEEQLYSLVFDSSIKLELINISDEDLPERA